MTDQTQGDGGVVNSDAATNTFAIPEEYSDRGWVEKIKSQDDLFKAYDNAQSMIGKRSVPAEDASDEEWNNFFKQAGAPDDPSEYQFSDVEGIPEDFDMSEFQDKARGIMKEAGLTKRQADKLYQLYLKEELSAANQNKESIQSHKAELDKQFDEVTQKMFGDKFEEVSAKAQAFIKETVPAEIIPEIQGLADTNPKALAAIIALTDKAQAQIAEIKQKYGAEDSFVSGQQTASGTSKDDVLRQLNEQRDLIRKSDPFSPDRKRAEEKMTELRAQLQSFFSS